LVKLEKKVDTEELNKGKIEEELALPSIYSDPSTLKEYTQKLGAINKNIVVLHDKWEDFAMEIDEMEG